MEFICLACRATMIPIAIKPDMKRVPHFRVEQEHESGCDIDGYEKLAQKRLKKPVSTLAGFSVPYPSQLRLPLFREVADKNQQHQSLIIADELEHLNRSNGTQLPTLKSHWTVTSIKLSVGFALS